MTTKRRYSGNDRHFGPFTLSEHNDRRWRPLGIMLDSGGDGDRGSKGCNLKLHGFGYTLIVELPQVVQDFRVRHTARSWNAETIAHMGRDWYEEVFPCEYGFTVSDGTVHVRYGPQTHDSITTKSKVLWIPWKQWRHVRYSLYDLSGNHFWTESARERYEVRWAVCDACPTAIFEIEDYDGTRIHATTRIEEREWRFGDGWFKWLSLFRRPKITRSLDIKFSAEVGHEKGSWKGGLVGTSIEMLPGELHEDAFRRYCEKEHLDKGGRYRVQFVGRMTQPGPQAELAEATA